MVYFNVVTQALERDVDMVRIWGKNTLNEERQTVQPPRVHAPHKCLKSSYPQYSSVCAEMFHFTHSGLSIYLIFVVSQWAIQSPAGVQDTVTDGGAQAGE